MIDLSTYFPILGKSIWGNQYQTIVLAALAGLVCFVVFAIVLKTVISQLKRLAKKTKTEWDDVIITILKKNGLFINLVTCFYIAYTVLHTSKKLDEFMNRVFVILGTFIVVRFFIGLIRAYFQFKYFTSDVDAGKRSVMKNFLLLIRVLFWTGGLLFILDNLGFDITTAVAGLGIGGMAIALASQSILADVFSYFSIFLDKPFEVGDFIVVGTQSGNVEHIGLKTTRVRSLPGEIIVFGNDDLIKDRIHNFKQMKERRMVNTIGVTYETPADKIKIIPGIIKEIIESVDNTRFDRAHFKTFGDFSLNFEIVFYVLTGAYVDAMEAQQKINVALFERFAKEDIEFAYPTQKLFVEKTA